MSINGRSFLALVLAGGLAAGCQQADEGQTPARDAAASKDAEAPKTSIAQAVAQSAAHKTLLGAVQAAGLEPTLSGAQPYTLFAPLDAAFQKLPEGGAGLLRAESKPQLTALLTNHIVPGVVTAKDLTDAIERGKGKAVLATVGGSNLTFSREGDAIVVAGGEGSQAQVTGAEMRQSNGVVHAIDGVLTPS